MPQPEATCYFKSTDGHTGAWAFSLTRLNWHVALLAANRGGAIIVDATRRGKTFPDALTKTVPLWAAVVNRAVGRYRRQHQWTTGNTDGTQDPSWDTSLHLPPWIASNERTQIEARLCGWTDQLLSVGVDLGGLTAILTKPLRPLWLGHNSRLLPPEQQPDLEELTFTPLYLISASEPNARHRIVPGGLGSRDATESLANVQSRIEEPYTASFQYIPGAGDDEETWSRGLTPPLLWMHTQLLLGAGPDDIADVVTQLPSAAQPPYQASTYAPLDGQSQPTAAAPRRLLSANSVQHTQQRPTLDGSHPAPQGLVQQAAITPGRVSCEQEALGLHPIGTTGVVIASLPALDVSQVTQLWLLVDVVLDIGTVPHAALSYQCTSRNIIDVPDVRGPCAVHTAGASCHHPSIASCQPSWSATTPIRQKCTGASPAAIFRLPIRDPKKDKTAMLRALPTAIQLVEARLRIGQRVLIHSNAGTDLPLCVALASILAHCLPTSSGDWRPSWLTQPQQKTTPLCRAVRTRDESDCDSKGNQTCDGCTSSRLDKSDFRRALAFVSAYCPEARPSARMLKQVSIALHVGGAPPADRPPAPQGNLKHVHARPDRTL